MAIKLMYITNRTDVALIAESAGVDRIFIDMEYIGKSDRQGGMDTVQSHHTVDDIRAIRSVITKSDIMVRVNPIHDGSKSEIDAVVAAGADIIMLPYFKTAKEVKIFVDLVGGRAKTLPLVETPEAVSVIDEILEINGIDEIFVGLNDLSLGYGKKFMFELLADGTVEALCLKFKQKGIPYGFGGLASLNGGMLPGSKVLTEHYRLGSTCVILSRSFCNVNTVEDVNTVREIFNKGVFEIRSFESECASGEIDFVENQKQVKLAVSQILEKIG